MNNVKITYQERIDMKADLLTLDGELVVGDAMFSEMVGVKNENGITLIPYLNIIKLEAKELDEVFLTSLDVLARMKAHMIKSENGKLNGEGGNHLFG